MLVPLRSPNLTLCKGEKGWSSSSADNLCTSFYWISDGIRWTNGGWTGRLRGLTMSWTFETGIEQDLPKDTVRISYTPSYIYSHTPKLTTNHRLSAVVHVRSFLVTRDLDSSTLQGATPFFNLAAGDRDPHNGSPHNWVALSPPTKTLTKQVLDFFIAGRWCFPKSPQPGGHRRNFWASQKATASLVCRSSPDTGAPGGGAGLRANRPYILVYKDPTWWQPYILRNAASHSIFWTL